MSNTYARVSCALNEDKVMITTNQYDVAVTDHILEKIWMPIRKRYLKEHGVSIVMTTTQSVDALKKDSEIYIALHFTADFRVKQPDRWLRQAVNEVTTELTDYLSEHTLY